MQIIHICYNNSLNDTNTMKIKPLIVSCLLTLGSLANATNIVMVSETNDGTRLVVDSDSFIIQKDNNISFIGAQFAYVTEGEFSTPFAFVTEVNACRNRNGLIHYRVLENNAWVTRNKYFWSSAGTKMFDRAGESLCDILDVRVREYKEKEKAKGQTY